MCCFSSNRGWACISALSFLFVSHLPAGRCWALEHAIYVSPGGNDAASGERETPLRTLYRARALARRFAERGDGDVVVSLDPGVYRLDRALELTEADSGRNGFRVIYRSAAGPGKAHLLGSRTLIGWKPYRDGIWKIDLPPGASFHTLYENGRRVHKARWPDYRYVPEMPTSLGRYAVTVDGTPRQSSRNPVPMKGPGWLQYSPEETPPVTAVTKMRVHIYANGKCDWVREIRDVTGIDPQTRRITTATVSPFGVGADARFFLEDELGFLNVPGEYFVDESSHTLYYMPLGKGHPDALSISYPLVGRMFQLRGKSRMACVENVVLDGLALEETDDSPPLALWATAGLVDGALVWMNNAARIEIRNCHLRNGGRSGIMMIGHNVENLVAGCWIEHMGLNGVSFSNKFQTPDKKAPTADRCEKNRIHNTHISHVGELHSYAECVTVFNASHNEVDHCQLDNSVRYAITVRGNTGAQYGPPVWTEYPPAKGNHFHHLRVFRCGQDGGDMGALHCANLNNPGGGNVNTFDEITVADTAAIASMKDIPPNGIFLDWPKMSMDQVFRNVQIVRSQGQQLRSNGPDNADSARTENVSWKPGFREDLMDYEHIGLTADFPAEFGGRPATATPLPAPARLRAKAVSHDRIELEWDAPPGQGIVEYVILRDGQESGRSAEPRWVDRRLQERTLYRYRVAARSGDFTRFGPAGECSLTTPADRTPPEMAGARVSPDGRRVRVAFSEPVEAKSAGDPSHYRFEPPLALQSVKRLAPAAVELSVEGYEAKTVYQLSVQGVSDTAAARNRIAAAKPLRVGRFDVTVRYPSDGAPGHERLEDTSGGGGDALLRGGATIEADAGPQGGAALVLDGQQGFAEAPNDLNLGPGDFTLGVWIYREKSGVIVSKGTDFGHPDQWSFGTGKADVPGSIALRVNNHYFATAERSVKDRQWTHLAFVRRASEGQCYVNGQPSGGANDMSGIGPLVNDRPLRIGRREYETNPMYFKGKVAGLTIWPRALSPQEIQEQSAGLPSRGR